MAWRLAIWPTSRSPLSVIATIDGVMRLPSELAMTTGAPPDTKATHEFVVPRSIPITLPMESPFRTGLTERSRSAMCCPRHDVRSMSEVLPRPGGPAQADRLRAVSLGRRGLSGHRHQRRPQNPAAQEVPTLLFLDPPAGLARGGVGLGERLVQRGVERLTDRDDRLGARLVQRVLELPRDQVEAVDDRGVGVDAPRVRDRALQIVGHRQQLPQHLLRRVLGVIELVPLRQLLVVFKLGVEPEVTGLRSEERRVGKEGRS